MYTLVNELSFTVIESGIRDAYGFYITVPIRKPLAVGSGDYRDRYPLSQSA
jgi:hypothetical protein